MRSIAFIVRNLIFLREKISMLAYSTTHEQQLILLMINFLHIASPVIFVICERIHLSKRELKETEETNSPQQHVACCLFALL
jgi:large-conductance mechanosensitive channel